MKVHKFDGVSFFSGLFITAIGLIFLIANDPSDIIDGIGSIGGWFWPLLLLIVGVAVLVPALIPKKQAEEELESKTD
jgi:hypothetical protein